MDLTRMKNAYHLCLDLVKNNRGSFSDKSLCMFVPEAGQKYKNGIFFIGRAPRGWDNTFDKTDDGEYKGLHDVIDRMHFGDMAWIYRKLSGQELNYNPNRSALWRTIRYIGNHYEKTDIGNGIYNHIAWSDLYKFAHESRNPSSRLMALQVDYMVEIYKAEIEIFRPQVVVYLTGLNWARPFIASMQTKKYEGQYDYVEAVFRDINTGVLHIVGPHPMGKDEGTIRKEICLAMNSPDSVQ